MSDDEESVDESIEEKGSPGKKGAGQLQAYLAPLRFTSGNNLTERSEDGDDSRYFMSEPSMSEDEGDDIEVWNRASPLLQSPNGGDDDASDERLARVAQRARMPSPHTVSSGTTSLSSTEINKQSACNQPKVMLQFTSDTTAAAATSNNNNNNGKRRLYKRSRRKMETTASRDDEHDKVAFINSSKPPPTDDDDRKDETFFDKSSRSTSSASLTNQQQQPAPEHLLDTSLQREVLQNAPSSWRREQHLEASGDGTLCLSDDSETEDFVGPLDWEQQQMLDKPLEDHGQQQLQTTTTATSGKSRRNKVEKKRSKQPTSSHAATTDAHMADAPIMEDDLDDGVSGDDEGTTPHIQNRAGFFARWRGRHGRQQGTGQHSSEEAIGAGYPIDSAGYAQNMGSASKSSAPSKRREQRRIPWIRRTVPERNERQFDKDLSSVPTDDDPFRSHHVPSSTKSNQEGSSSHSLRHMQSNVSFDDSGHYSASQRRRSVDGDYRRQWSQGNSSFDETSGHSRRLSIDEDYYRQGSSRHYSKQQSFDASNGSSRGSSFSWLSDRQPSVHSAQQSPLASQSVQLDSISADLGVNSDRDVLKNKLQYQMRDTNDLGGAEQLLESRTYRGNAQNVMRTRFHIDESSQRSKTASFTFKPLHNVVEGNDRDHPTFSCPKCGTRQRSFFTALSAPARFEGPSGYLAFYFTVYVAASLYIFGLEEGWSVLDCVYFAVITLVTGGLGDLVPTSDTAKIICSIFIYFGVACIGLLLGTYIAGMLDDRSVRESMKARVDNCMVCSTAKTVRRTHRRELSKAFVANSLAAQDSRAFEQYTMSERSPQSVRTPNSAPNASMDLYSPEMGNERRMRFQREGRPTSARNMYSMGSPGSTRQPFFSDLPEMPQMPSNASTNAPTPKRVITEPQFGDSPISATSGLNVIDEYGGTRPHHVGSPRSSPRASPRSPVQPSYPSPIQNARMLSPRVSVSRRHHTRHESFDVNNSNFFGQHHSSGRNSDPTHKTRKMSEDFHTTYQHGNVDDQDAFHSSLRDVSGHSHGHGGYLDEGESEELLYDYDSDDTEMDDPSGRISRIKNGKYVFVTLRQALMNSIVIISIGSIGFFFIEKMTLVDSFYFTTVLLTTVGYGDIVPVTSGGKLFAIIYMLSAGTVLLNNMSLISMIPLELRRRRIERAVLTQFGDQLDDGALRELATGPLVKRLQLSSKRSDGLDECNREMFALAMLVRLGKVTERDIRQTFKAFRRLDVDNEGVLNSKTIITGMMKKRRSMRDLREMDARSQPPPPPPADVKPSYWFGNSGSLHALNETFKFGQPPPPPQQQNDVDKDGERMALLDDNDNTDHRTFDYQQLDEEEGVEF